MVQRYTGRPALSWADFKREFEEKYYSRALQEKKWIEFMNLKQGGMLVAEYEQKFTELSEFAPSVVANDADRCKKYQDGLHVSIRDRLTTLDTDAFNK